MKSTYILLALTFCCGACNNIEDAKPAERKTFVRFYEDANNLFGVSVEPDGDGYIAVANELSLNQYSTRVIHLDKSGAESISERITLPNFFAKALKTGPDGYYITGDRIQVNPASENLFDLSVTSAVMYRISPQGDTTSYIAADTASTGKIDFHGSSVTLDANGNVILLGTFKQAKNIAYERPFITALDPATLDTLWTKRYEVLERDYINSKSVHANSTGNIIWASALLRETGDLTRTFMSIPFVKEESVFINNDLYGETTDQQLLVSDIQPTESTAFGYGVIGTYALPNGDGANIIFLRVNQDGNIIPGSERFFDGEKLTENTTVPAAESHSKDSGTALIATSDGGFLLAGTMQTTPNRGKGGLDILLIKVDGLGNVVWNKIMGGIGDESINSIRKTPDGNFVLCGSNNLGGLSSLLVIKLDSLGEVLN